MRGLDEPITDHPTTTLCDRTVAGVLLHGDLASVIDVYSRHTLYLPD